jgi:hypothetical protein
MPPARAGYIKIYYDDLMMCAELGDARAATNEVSWALAGALDRRG